MSTIAKPIDRPVLADQVAKAARDMFADGKLRQLICSSDRDRRPQAIQQIVQAFYKLGKSLGYRVATTTRNRKQLGADAEQGWSYDLVWLLPEDEKEGYTTCVPLALECELNPLQNDDDFLKLVQGRAEVRVWVARDHNHAEHIKVCKEQIRRFTCSQSEDTYVLILSGVRGETIETFVNGEPL
jgi:hypothetical protein